MNSKAHSGCTPKSLLTLFLAALFLCGGIAGAGQGAERNCMTRKSESGCKGRLCASPTARCGPGKECLKVTTHWGNPDLGTFRCYVTCECKEPDKKEPKGKKVNANGVVRGGPAMFFGTPTEVTVPLHSALEDWLVVWDQHDLDDLGNVHFLEGMAGNDGFAGSMTFSFDNSGPPQQIPVAVTDIHCTFGPFTYLGRSTGVNTLTPAGDTSFTTGYYDSTIGETVFDRWVPVILTNDLYPSGQRVLLTTALNTTAVANEFEVDLVIDAFLDVGTNFCSATVNSTGAATEISAQGSASVSQNLLQLSASDVPVGNTGLFFYGQGESMTPFGDGLLCISATAGYQRLPGISADGDGFLSHMLDLSHSTHSSQLVPGSTWLFQAWYRDPGAGGGGFNLSDGLQVEFEL